VEIDVTDLGIGIPDDDLDKIFDEFVQLSQPNQHQGTGLGLPISRRLAVLLDGSLTVRSTPGEGSTFRLTLPAKVTDVGGVALIDSGFPSPNGAPPIAALPTIPDLPVALVSPAADASADEPAAGASSPDAAAPDAGTAPVSATEGRRRKRDTRGRSEGPSAGESVDEDSVESTDPAAHVTR
jgi:hypothetical protein